MKKQVLNLIFFATTLSLIAQNSSKVQIMPAPSTNLLSKEQVGFDMNAPKTLTCNDTLRYPQIKEQIIGNSSFAIFELWASDLEEMSQTFLVSGTSHQINGVEFFGRKKPGASPPVTVRASIYSVDANNNPIGPELGFGTITISDTNFTYRQINFANSVTVSSNYAVVIKPTNANGIVQFYVNNPAPNQVYDEDLSRVKSAFYSTSNNNWVSVLTLTTVFPQGPYDFEMIVAPKVSYNINTDFTVDPSPGCVGAPVALINATDPASLISNRMYNFSAMQMHFLNEPDSLYAWNPGVTPQVILWGTNASYTYTSANNYNVTLYTLGGLWTSCLDQKTITHTVGAAPAAPTSIVGNNSVCTNSSYVYSVNPVQGATSYTWTLPNGWTGNSTSDTIQVTVGPNGGTITVTASNVCGSSNATTLAVVVDTAAPAQPSVIIGDTTVCQNSTQTYSAFSAGATSYTWTLPNGWTGSSTSDSIQVSAGSNGGTITVIANNGCGSSAPQTLAITVNPLPDVTVSYNANTLTANQAGATYQWIDCNNNNAPISGANNQSFTPTTSGSYAVVVTLNGCSDTSACQTVTIAGVDTEALTKQVFSIYPNPNRGNFTIQGTKGGVFELIDVTGKVINTYTITNTQQTVNENIPAGMYFVREKESGVLQKLVVQ